MGIEVGLLKSAQDKKRNLVAKLYKGQENIHVQGHELRKHKHIENYQWRYLDYSLIASWH